MAQLTQIKDLFAANSSSLWETMQIYGNRVGYWIPPFQREYSWTSQHLTRLLEDCLNGFSGLTGHGSSESYTFLGTVILVRNDRNEPRFDGTSLSVIDGQQRITTLSLLCCALIQRLREHFPSATDLPEFLRIWVEEEHQSLTNGLFECTNGWQMVGAKNYSFPRIVRGDKDMRSNSPRSAEYSSEIAAFLDQFAKYFRNDASQFPTAGEKTLAVSQNYEKLLWYVDRYVAGTSTEIDYASMEDSLDCDLVPKEEFETRRLRALLEKSGILEESKHLDRAMSHISSQKSTEAYFRLVFFSWYLLKRVVITRIETDDTEHAFDIFDALNTTGEPLTAIETLKPLVLRTANGQLTELGEGSLLRFEQLEEYLNTGFSETELRQRESKQLVLLFAQYQYGKKLGLDLRAQRNFLRSRFPDDRTADDSEIYEFVNSFTELAQYRRDYWTDEGLRAIDGRHPNTPETKLLQLCLSFVFAMKTIMAIPVLTRYWAQYYDDRADNDFVDAVKSIAAYLAIRRAVTGGTSGIDGEFRSLMEKISVKACPRVPSDATLRSMLRQSLKKSRINVTDRQSWVDQASATAVGDKSRPLCRFLLLAAAHNSRPDDQRPGLLTRSDVLPSEDLAYLTPGVWSKDLYGTVEHIAPESPRGSEWPSAIYQDRDLCHTIGNLVLLPQNENRSASNSSWAKKKLFYKALSAESVDDRQNQIAQAKELGIKFSRKTINLLANQGRLRMLDHIAAAEKWDANVIRSRSRNLLELAWDEFGDWVFD